MDYTKLAKEFIENTHRLRKFRPQMNIRETMHGEAFVLLYVFKKGDSVLPSEISNEMEISTARVAAALNNLENKGLITRRIDTSDRRKILVDLTESGKEMAEKHEAHSLNGATHMLEMLGEHDAIEFVRIMNKFAEVSKQCCGRE